jgi:hypothetical protein
MVSPEGLVFTNHHCGYEVIASASTVDHNYLLNGFYSKSRGEEIPAEGLTVQFLLRIDDVTKEVMDSLQGLTGMDRIQRQPKSTRKHQWQAFRHGTKYRGKSKHFVQGQPVSCFHLSAL